MRTWEMADAESLWQAVDGSRARLREWLPWIDVYRSVQDAETFIARAIMEASDGISFHFAIVDRMTERLLGGTGFNRPDWAVRAFEIGYWLTNDAVGHGYVTEAVQALTRLAFERLRAERVEIRCDPRNARSRAIPERLGFQLDGQLRSNTLDPDGRPRDTLVFSVIRTDSRPAWLAPA
jgi:RimJ/RimL family protein N-acetyltransferase